MGKGIYQKFLDFKSRYGFSNEKIAEIAIEYANSSLDCARSYFSAKYKISESTFYKVRDYAIIFCLVDKKTYDQIKEKSSTNQKNNVNNPKKNAATSLAYFDELLVKQQEFLDGFSNNEIIDIAQKYVEGVSLKNIGIAYDTGEYAIQLLLKKGVVELILDSEIVSQLSKIVGHALDKTLKRREYNKKLLLNCIENKISFLRSQISCYDLYFRNSKNKPSLESLNEELANAIKMYNETLKL